MLSLKEHTIFYAIQINYEDCHDSKTHSNMPLVVAILLKQIHCPRYKNCNLFSACGSLISNNPSPWILL